MKQICFCSFVLILIFAGCSARFQLSKSGTIIDSKLDLEWLPDPGTHMTWSEAEDYVKKLTTGGHKNWRLPTREELSELHYPEAQNSPKIAQEFRLMHEMVWTSEQSTCRGVLTRWAIYFGDIPTMYGCGKLPNGQYYDRPPGRVAQVLAVRSAR